MSLTPPKRLFHIPTMSTVMYVDVADDVKKKGYVAVSHVWGDQEMYSADKFGINSGVDWEIPLSNPNKISRLETAMKRYKMEYCWLDVVCLTQNNQDEMNKEIPLMGDYYAGARMTLVLATENNTNFRPLTKLTGIASRFLNIGPDTITTQLATRAKLGMNDIVEDPWFERVWTFQEAVLSRNVKIVGFNKYYVDLSEILDKLLLEVEKTGISSTCDEERLARAIKDHSQHKTNLGRALYSCSLRQCVRPQDKFYGMLGILGYTEFPVTYDMDMEDLNRKIIQYAYSKGDVSWLSIGFDNATSFIQPLYEDVKYIGEMWKEEKPGICGIKFEDKVLHINACMVASVTHRKNFLSTGELQSIVEEWGFDDRTIISAITGYCELSDEEIRDIPLFLERDVDVPKPKRTLKDRMRTILGRSDENGIDTKMEAHIGSHDTTDIFQITSVETGKKWPIMLCGRCNIGDKVMLLQVHDNLDRTLGIVVDDSFRRRGMCLYPRAGMSGDGPRKYTPHKFLL